MDGARQKWRFSFLPSSPPPPPPLLCSSTSAVCTSSNCFSLRRMRCISSNCCSYVHSTATAMSLHLQPLYLLTTTPRSPPFSTPSFPLSRQDPRSTAPCCFVVLPRVRAAAEPSAFLHFFLVRSSSPAGPRSPARARPLALLCAQAWPSPQVPLAPPPSSPTAALLLPRTKRRLCWRYVVGAGRRLHCCVSPSLAPSLSLSLSSLSPSSPIHKRRCH